MTRYDAHLAVSERVARLLLVLVVVALVVGCQTTRPANPPPAPPPSTRPLANAKPLIDFSRGAGGFPLSGESLPATLDELVKSLSAGYEARVSIPADHAAVVATGEHYPSLDALLIDLSDSRIKTDFRPSSMRAAGKIEPGLRVKYLQYVARPLRYTDGSTNLSITARDVKLDVLHSRRGGEPSTLVMTEAADGRVQFDVNLTDLRAMFRSAARAAGSRNGYLVRDVEPKFTSVESRSLACEVRVRGFWLFLPTTFKLTGRIDVDDAQNARLSDIGCTGEDVGGFLLAGWIDSALKKYDGRVMPLATFPGGKIKVRDLHIGVDDALHISVAFGS
jgi:hypothetical protein